jgi:hypothetical protein
MRIGLKFAWCAGLLLVAASTACAQAPAVARTRAQSILSSGSLASASGMESGRQGVAPGEQVSGEIVREIDDPHTGDRWLLLRDAEVPGGPGRLVRIAALHNESGGTTGPSASPPQDTALLPVIHSGDRLTVVEHTARVDATLEARALAPAAVGGSLEVRLAIGGRVARVVALGAGRAVFQPETGARP